jgi:hypothetical protein
MVADALCNELAEDAELGGVWMAFLVDADWAISRLLAADEPYVRLDGVQLGANWMDFSDSTQGAPLNITEHGATSSSVRAWTGLYVQEIGLDQHCDSWTSKAAECTVQTPCGGAGEVTATDEHWSGYFVYPCASWAALYCLEQ